MGRGRLGSQQGMQRTIAARQQTARYQVSALRSMDDAHLSVALDDIFDNHPWRAISKMRIRSASSMPSDGRMNCPRW